MESRVQPLEKTLYPAAGTKISAGAADPARSDLSGSSALSRGSDRRGHVLESEPAGAESGAPGRNL